MRQSPSDEAVALQLAVVHVTACVCMNRLFWQLCWLQLTIDSQPDLFAVLCHQITPVGDVLASIPVEMTYTLAPEDDSLAVRGGRGKERCV